MRVSQQDIIPGNLGRTNGPSQSVMGLLESHAIPGVMLWGLSIVHKRDNKQKRRSSKRISVIVTTRILDHPPWQLTSHSRIWPRHKPLVLPLVHRRKHLRFRRGPHLTQLWTAPRPRTPCVTITIIRSDDFFPSFLLSLLYDTKANGYDTRNRMWL